MTHDSRQLLRRNRRQRVQQWFSDRCADIGMFWFRLCEKLETGPCGVPCPDCGVPVDVGPDDPCPECEERAEQKIRDRALTAAAYDDGYAAGWDRGHSDDR